MFPYFLAVLIPLLVSLVPAVSANDTGPGNENSWSVQLGAGARAAPLYRGSSTYGVSALPFLRVSYDNRYSLGPGGLRARLHATDAYEIDVGLVYNFGRDEVEESDLGGAEDDHLRGMGDVDGAVGTRFGVSTRNLPVTVDASVTEYWGSDVEGRTATVRLSRRIPLRRGFVVVPGVGLEWANGEYREPFFGVTRRQASRTGFRRHRVDSGWNRFRVGLRTRMAFSERWAFRAGIVGSRLLGDAADSPISREGTSVSVLSGFVRRF